VNIGVIVHELAVLLQQEANESSISIHTSLSAGIPDIMADRIQLQQALMNLMLNAIDAMKDSGGEMTISAEPSSDAQLLITVSARVSDCRPRIPMVSSSHS
jgi:signal transduction histidine kinase